MRHGKVYCNGFHGAITSRNRKVARQAGKERRKRERQRQRQRQTETNRDKQRQTHRERERERARHTHTHTHIHTHTKKSSEEARYVFLSTIALHVHELINNKAITIVCHRLQDLFDLGLRGLVLSCLLQILINGHKLCPKQPLPFLPQVGHALRSDRIWVVHLRLTRRILGRLQENSR